MRRFPVLLALLLLVAPACRPGGEEAERGELPPTPAQGPAPAQLPLVWVAGTVEHIDEDVVAVRSGEDAVVRMQRLASGATRFFATDGDRWRQLGGDEVEAVETGREACAEALLDGENLVALRVFLDAACGPS